MFPKIGVPQNRLFIMENPIKMDDLGVPLFLETPIYIYIFYIHRCQLSLKPPMWVDLWSWGLWLLQINVSHLCLWLVFFLRLEFHTIVLSGRARWLFCCQRRDQSLYHWVDFRKRRPFKRHPARDCTYFFWFGTLWLQTFLQYSCGSKIIDPQKKWCFQYYDFDLPPFLVGNRYKAFFGSNGFSRDCEQRYVIDALRLSPALMDTCRGLWWMDLCLLSASVERLHRSFWTKESGGCWRTRWAPYKILQVEL